MLSYHINMLFFIHLTFGKLLKHVHHNRSLQLVINEVSKILVTAGFNLMVSYNYYKAMLNIA